MLSPTTHALLPPVPVPMPPWVRVAIAVIETVATGVIWASYQYGMNMNPTQSVDTDPPPDQWRKFVFKAENMVSSNTADDQFFGFEIVNVTNGAVDSTWDDEDYTIVTDALLPWIQTVREWISSIYTVTELQAYIRQFNPYTQSKPFPDGGAPERRFVLNQPGGGSSEMPPQVCTSITELTPNRRHWGRTYLPTLGRNTITLNGRLGNSVIDSIVTATHTAFEQLQQNEMYPVVVTTHANDGVPTRVLSVITNVRVDDVTDIIRRRRYRDSIYQNTLPALA